MKKILVLFLSLLALTFVACGKDKDIRDILDKEKISSEFNIVEENEKYFEFNMFIIFFIYIEFRLNFFHIQIAFKILIFSTSNKS